MGAGIFISYRREDSRHAAGRLADDLSDAFGGERIFRDIEGIDLGVRFGEALEKALAACSVMLVLIGPRWLTAQDAQGRRRLERPEDWVRQEVATALARGIPVVPVLLEGAALPTSDELTADLQGLIERQKIELSDERWRGDVQSLIARLARLPGLERRPPPVTDSKTDPVGAPPVSAVPPTAPEPGAKRRWSSRWTWGSAALTVFVWLANLGEQPAPTPTGVQSLADPAAGASPAPAPTQGQTTAPPTSTGTAPGATTPTAAAPVPQVAGLWRSLSGEVYDFAQQGRRLQVEAHQQGQLIARGDGELDPDGLLRVSMSVNLPQGPANLVCNLQLTADSRTMSGQCIGPQGVFPAQMFR